MGKPDFPIIACKLKNFMSHMIRALYIKRKVRFDHESGASEK